MKALITGASGIGKFVAEKLKATMEVVTHSRRGNNTDYSGDLTDSATVEALFRLHPVIDVFVACHGGNIQGTGMDNFKNVMDLNLFSVVNCCERVAESMPDGGRIITVGSYAGCFGRPDGIAYSTAKAALHEYTKCLAAKLRSRHITVNCVVPGNTTTERFLEEHGPRDDAGTPEEVASVIAFLCGPEASHVSGQAIRIDGARHTFPC